MRERKRKWECFGSKVRAFLHPNNNTHQETTPKPQKEVESTLKPQKWAFSWTLRVFWRKTKMESKEGRRGAYHSMAQPNNIKGRGEGYPLIANTKPQVSRIWVCLWKEKRREEKKTHCKCKSELWGLRKGLWSLQFSFSHPDFLWAHPPLNIHQGPSAQAQTH